MNSNTRFLRRVIKAVARARWRDIKSRLRDLTASKLPADELWKKWQQDFAIIYNETLYAFSNRAVWRSLQEILNGNTRLQNDGGYFWRWLQGCYGRDMVLAVAREVDRYPTVVNLMQMMNQMTKRPEVVSRKRFFDTLGPVRPFIREMNERWFTENFGPGETADPAFIKKDRNRLQRKCKAVLTYRHKMVAHRSAEEMPLTLKQIHDSMDAIEEILKKYHILLKGSALMQAEPAVQFDWTDIFSFPWAPRPEDGNE